MTLLEFLKKTTTSILMPHRPRIVCIDGFSMSVQASSFNYCSPRLDNAGDYRSAEIGFPSEAEPTIIEYAEDKEFLTNTVYGYVPVATIQKVIDLHGGIDLVKTFIR